jgi:hypothetical protein
MIEGIIYETLDKVADIEREVLEYLGYMTRMDQMRVAK